jgi:hypothetical protein
LFQFSLHVDVGEELFRQVFGESGLDLFVLEQLVARADPVVGVERLSVDPGREDAQERDQSGDDQQGRDDARVACSAFPSGTLGRDGPTTLTGTRQTRAWEL